jgi:hypothetical protein
MAARPTVGNQYHPSYLLEKFRDVIGTLATGPGDARSRVAGASMAIEHLQLRRIPPSIRRDMRWIRDQTDKRVTDAWNPDRPASMPRSQNRTASKIAKRMLKVYMQVVEAEATGKWPKGERRTVRRPKRTTVH